MLKDIYLAGAARTAIGSFGAHLRRCPRRPWAARSSPRRCSAGCLPTRWTRSSSATWCRPDWGRTRPGRRGSAPGSAPASAPPLFPRSADRDSRR